MSLVRALASACIALSLAFGVPAQGSTARAGSITPDPADTPSDDHPIIIVADDELQARGIRVLTALLVVLTTSGAQGLTVPQGKIAEFEGLLSNKLMKEILLKKPTTATNFKYYNSSISNNSKYITNKYVSNNSDNAPSVTALSLNHRYVTGNAIAYKISHTFSTERPIFRSPSHPTFAAPCDGKTWFGWPCAEAPEMPGDQLTRWVGVGERPKLSDGLHRRRREMIPDVILGQNALPSADGMNLNGFAHTNGPALDIAER